MSELIAIAAFKIQNPIEAPFRAIASWRRRSKTRKALNNLNARELADIGLERADIEKVAKRF